MSGNNELLQALMYLGKSGQEYGLSRAINQANEEAKALKGSMMDDMEKRMKLSNLADDIAARMAGGGAQGQHIAAVAQSIKPMTASTAEQALMLGMQNGDQSLANMGKEVMDMEAQKKLDFLNAQADAQLTRDKTLYGYQDAMLDKKLATQEKNAELKAKKEHFSKLPAGVIDKITNVDNAAEQLNGILAKLDADPDKYGSMVGAVDGRIPGVFQGAETSAFQADLGRFAAGYISSVSGAGVTDSERKILMANIPNKNERPEQIKKKIEEMIKTGAQVRSRHLANFQSAGYNTGDLARNAPAAFTPAAGQASTDPKAPALQAAKFTTYDQ